jgi:hypothetical protein
MEMSSTSQVLAWTSVLVIKLGVLIAFLLDRVHERRLEEATKMQAAAAGDLSTSQMAGETRTFGRSKMGAPSN